MKFCNFFLCSVAVAAAGALLPLSVYAAELEDFEDESVVGSPVDQSNSQGDDVLPTPELLESSPSPSPDLVSDELFPSISPGITDSIFWDDSGLTDDDFLEVEPSASPDLVPDQVFDLSDQDGDIEPYASYDVYYGSIGSTYLEYMRGYLPKLHYRDHYVGARVSQYTYIFAYGEDLTWNGSMFVGFNVNVITWNTQNNGTFSHGIQSAFNLNPGYFLVYSDLTDFYPSLADSSAFTLRQLLILFTVFFLSLTMIHMYNVRKVRRS